MKKLSLIAALGFALAVPTANANLVINGDFEDLGSGSYNGQGWNLFSSIPGWTSGVSGVNLEIGKPSVYGVNGFGEGVMELDSTQNVVATQVLGATPGSYTLSFYYALRQNVDPSSGRLEVWWNGIQVDSLTPSSQNMTAASYTVSLIAGNNTLEFRGAGTSDSYGALIDSVSVVPEPATLLAGALLLLPFGASTLRRIRRA